MWDSNQNESTNTYQRNTEWFAGPFDTPVNKPPAIIKWEQNTTCYEPINKFFARLRAINQLEDLSTIAMTYTKKEVKTRLSFETNEHGQSVAPTVFALETPTATYFFTPSSYDRNARRPPTPKTPKRAWNWPW